MSMELISFVSGPSGPGLEPVEACLPTELQLESVGFSNQQCFETRWGFTLVIYNNKIDVLQPFLQPFLLIVVLQL